ncbi:MAG: TIGR03960 family B12-binding radical SAM protein [Coriobacteriales bacterium]
MQKIRERVNLWPRIEPLLDRVEKPSRYIDHEWGAARRDADFRLCLAYPDTYEVGLPNQGLAILYSIVNSLPGMTCERAYLPWVDMADLMRAADLPLSSMESAYPVASFDVVGLTIPHELAATNFVEFLELSGLEVMATDREQDDPIVIAGGPSCYNPEPVSSFFDAIIIGDGEQAIVDVCERVRDQRRRAASRKETLRALSEIPGVYVPSLYEQVSGPDGRGHVVPLRGSDGGQSAPEVVVKRVVPDFGATDPIVTTIVPYQQIVHDRLAIEVLRGCARGCRFCQAGMTYRPVRERSADQVVAACARGLACTGFDEVSLTSLSTTDHSRISEILRRLNRQISQTGVSVSLPSERLDSFGVEMAELVAGEKKGGLTFAPEAGTQRLRDVINKNVTEQDLMRAVDASFAAGWRRMKLYFMMGLPTETDDDVRGIAELTGRAYQRALDATPRSQRGAVKMSISVAVFIPKAQTAFQWCGQLDPDTVRARQKLLLESIPFRGIRVSYHDYASSFLEAVLSRGGREVTPLVIEAHRLGARFDAWSERFDLDVWRQAASNVGVDMADEACRPFQVGQDLPWQHISAGVSQRYLRREWERALAGKTTPDCTFSGCTGCGVCPALGVENDLAGVRGNG